MNTSEDKKDIYDRVSSSLLFKVSFAAIAIIGCAVTIYAAFFQEKKSQVQYIVTANYNVLDVNTELSKVDILYDNTSLNESNLNLRIYNIKVVNNGEADVLKSLLDENEPLGISIENGEIVEKPEITETSSSYLQKTLRAVQKEYNQIEFSNVIIERGEYFSIKILVIHENSVIPQLVPIGKIAGQKEIRLINASEVRTERPFFIETFSGNIWIQLVRLMVYFISSVIVIIIILTVTEKINNTKTTKEEIKD